MNMVNILKIINITIAMASIPPALGLIIYLWRERKGLLENQRSLNAILIYLLIPTTALANAAISALSLFNPFAAHSLSLARSIFLTVSATMGSWALYLYKRSIK